MFACIPLFQSIKDVPVYSKVMKVLYLRILDRKRKDPKIVHVMGKLLELMMGGVLTTKYLELGTQWSISKSSMPLF